jgi:hypothetical protein
VIEFFLWTVGYYIIGMIITAILVARTDFGLCTLGDWLFLSLVWPLAVLACILEGCEEIQYIDMSIYFRKIFGGPNK